MKKELVRNPYNYDSDQLSQDTGLHCKDETLTQQQFAEEADINYITDRFMRTGQLPQVINMPTDGDFSGTFDFQSSMNLLKKANDEFNALPAKLRARFENDPAQLIDFLKDENNAEEAHRLGLIDKETIERRRAASTTGENHQPAQPKPNPPPGGGQATVENSTPAKTGP